MARPTTGGISLRSLTKSFRGPGGPVHAVRGIDIDIAPGETVALLGPNGAGKSTTIDMLLGLTKPDAGEVRLFEKSPAGAIASGAVGAMLQTGAVLSDLSVRELVDMMGSLYPSSLTADETLELAGIREIAERKTNKLSGGQTQRVRFAVAMVSDPDLLVLDEPTVGMDVESRHQFWDTMRAFTARGKTVLFATHYLEEADANADRIVLTARGKIVADGAATEIKAVAGGRTMRGTLPAVDLDALRRLDGVRDAELRGDAFLLNCSDSDRTVRALLREFPEVRDLEITGAGLEAAFIFSLIFPLMLFVLIAGTNKDQTIDVGGLVLKFPTYYMVSMAGYGAMIATISGGARIAAERAVGWNRQLRITPLSVRTYFATKVLTSYAVALCSIALLYIAGIAYGVHISPFSRWIEMTALLLVGLAPFVAIGIFVGHLLTIDSMGPAVGGGTALFGFLGGQWFPIPEHGALHVIGQGIPSYWLTRAGQVGVGAPAWALKGWIVIGVWTVAMAALAGLAYRRDTAKQ